MVPSHLSKRFSDAETDCECRQAEGARVNFSGVQTDTTPSRSSRSSGSSLESNTTKQRRQDLKGKTALQVTRGGVTVAVCRLVCAAVATASRQGWWGL